MAKTQRLLSDELRTNLKSELAAGRLETMFGDGQDEEYVMDGVNIVGLNDMSDADLLKEYTVEQLGLGEDQANDPDELWQEAHATDNKLLEAIYNYMKKHPARAKPKPKSVLVDLQMLTEGRYSVGRSQFRANMSDRYYRRWVGVVYKALLEHGFTKEQLNSIDPEWVPGWLYSVTLTADDKVEVSGIKRQITWRMILSDTKSEGGPELICEGDIDQIIKALRKLKKEQGK